MSSQGTGAPGPRKLPDVAVAWPDEKKGLRWVSILSDTLCICNKYNIIYILMHSVLYYIITYTYTYIIIHYTIYLYNLIYIYISFMCI